MPRVSVLMPAYNAEKYIKEAIDSILNQTFTDFEFIILDDGSNDRTVEIVKKYTDSRIYLYQNEHNMGIAATLNRGLDLAVGEYIARMDSDDISLPERFEKQIAYMDEHPNVAVLGTGIRLFGAQSREKFFSISSEQLKVDALFGCCLAHPSVMMRKNVFGSGKLTYDNTYNKMEDFDLWVRVAEKYDLASIPEILFQYRIHPYQVTKRSTQEDRKQMRMLKARQIQALGMKCEGALFDRYLSYCLGEFETSPENLICLAEFFANIKEKNTSLQLYDEITLKNTLNAVIRSQLAKLPKGQVIQIAQKCGINPLSYGIERTVRSIITRVRRAIQLKKRQSRLRSKDFSIISNNCWGSFIYQKYGLKYRTPTVGLYILGHDFVKLCSNWKWYMEQKLRFIPWENATYYYAIKDSTPYPVAMLGDIEIYFMHYRSEKEAAAKWYRRAKRIHSQHLLFKLSQREECSKKDIEDFMKLPLEHKICFAYDVVPGTVHIPELKDFIGDEMDIVNHHFDDLEILNTL